ncbi:MAG TPA: hypothetical protein P5075_07845 [Eubacteriales bacterium]|nr:hypothetical protein [Eubacteriales bacterium]
MLFGDESYKSLADAAKAAVRDPSNFNWTFIALLAFVVMLYVDEIHKKNYKAIAAALMLYSVHWLYEIANAVICHFSGYALWTVSPESTSFILLIGVSWELSMMFAVAGFTSKLLPKDKNMKILGVNNRIVFAIGSALFFSLVEIFLAWTPAFIWVYPWWGAIPVFITTYIPFFLASYLIYDKEPKTQKKWIASLAGVNIVLLATLIPLGII